MTTSLKDVASAQVVGKLADMDCFSKEYVTWGFGWLQDGRVRWRAGEDGNQVRRSYDELLYAGASLTPLVSRSVRAVLTKENRLDGLLLLRLRLLGELQSMYGSEYFDALRTLRDLPNDDAAYGAISEWRDEIDGYFEEDSLTLFDETVREVYLCGHLSTGHVKELLDWSMGSRLRGAAGAYETDQYSRTFLGCALTDDGETWQWLSNANEEVFWQQLEDRSKSGVWHTPVWRKTVWFHRMYELPAARRAFLERYRAVADDLYLERMRFLQGLPSKVPSDLWQRQLVRVGLACPPDACDGFLQMAYRLQLSKN